LSLSICGSHSCYNHEELGNEQTTWNTPTTHQELASCLYISFGAPGERERKRWGFVLLLPYRDAVV
jgi:hypothetical protein